MNTIRNKPCLTDSSDKMSNDENFTLQSFRIWISVLLKPEMATQCKITQNFNIISEFKFTKEHTWTQVYNCKDKCNRTACHYRESQKISSKSSWKAHSHHCNWNERNWQFTIQNKVNVDSSLCPTASYITMNIPQRGSSGAPFINTITGAQLISDLRCSVRLWH